MIVCDYIWLCMINIWLCMIIYDYIWLCMIIYDYIWLYMIIYDYIWLYMIIYDYVCVWMINSHCKVELNVDFFLVNLIKQIWTTIFTSKYSSDSVTNQVEVTQSLFTSMMEFSVDSKRYHAKCGDACTATVMNKYVYIYILQSQMKHVLVQPRPTRVSGSKA